MKPDRLQQQLLDLLVEKFREICAAYARKHFPELLESDRATAIQQAADELAEKIRNG